MLLGNYLQRISDGIWKTNAPNSSLLIDHSTWPVRVISRMTMARDPAIQLSPTRHALCTDGHSQPA
jgi:hypothetical protein